VIKLKKESQLYRGTMKVEGYLLCTFSLIFDGKITAIITENIANIYIKQNSSINLEKITNLI